MQHNYFRIIYIRIIINNNNTSTKLYALNLKKKVL